MGVGGRERIRRMHRRKKRRNFGGRLNDISENNGRKGYTGRESEDGKKESLRHKGIFLAKERTVDVFFALTY